MYKYRNEDMLYTGPVWDFDLAFDNDYRTYPVNSKNDYIYRSGGSCAGDMKNFVDNVIFLIGSTQQQLVDIWDKSRHAGLTEEKLVAWIDQMEAKLDASQKLNFMRWPILNAAVHMNPRTWGSYAAEVNNVRSFMKERLAWMDRRLDYTYVPSGINEVEIDLSQPYEVFTLAGQACGRSLDGLRAGIYIVKQGQSSKKIVKK